MESLNLALINCEIELDLSCQKNCVISEISRTLEVFANPNANPPTNRVPQTHSSKATFQTNNAKLFVPVITLCINNNFKFSENMKQGFKRITSWNKYRPGIIAQPKSNNFNYMIDPTFRNINRLFVLSFENGDDDPRINSFDKYYMSLL